MKRTKFTDLTSGQIYELKTRMSEKVASAICKVVDNFRKNIDFEYADVSVNTSIDTIETEQGEDIYRIIGYNVEVIFPKEEALMTCKDKVRRMEQYCEELQDSINKVQADIVRLKGFINDNNND